MKKEESVLKIKNTFIGRNTNVRKIGFNRCYEKFINFCETNKIYLQ